MMTVLFFLFLIAPTIQYRVELGPFSLTFMEPVVLFVSAVFFAWQIVKYRSLMVLKEPLFLFFLGFTLWALIVRPWASNWTNGLSDVRDWGIPLIGFIALVSTLRTGWRRRIIIFLIWVLVISLLGILQHEVNGLRPFVGENAALKTGFQVSPEDAAHLKLTSYAVGFFSHPNMYASYLFLGLMTSLGWFFSGKRNLWKIIPIVIIGLALFWAYAKASLVVMSLAVIWFWVNRWMKDEWSFLWLIGLAMLTAAAFVLIIVQYLPPALLETFWWRVGLWQTALGLIQQNPMILIFGNGMDLYSTQAYYPQPHNLFVYLLLQYGIIGLALILGLFGYIVIQGWKARRLGFMNREPILAGLWVGILGFFLIGLVESTLFGIDYRMIFMFALACFAGLFRELLDETSPVLSTERTYARETLAYSHPD